MRAHLMDALDQGRDAGHHGRLVFAMVARHFMSEDELCRWLRKDPKIDEQAPRPLWVQVEEHEYSPPRRETILEWQRQQAFPICPDDDPDLCSVYRDLKFPDRVYEHIQEYYEQKV